MKYLSDYIEKAQSACFEKHGVIFAFSTAQFDEQKKEEHLPYVSLGMGTLCPKSNVEAFINDHHNVVQEGIAQDIKENGKEAIIDRELCNHECFYTDDVQDAVDAVEKYGYTDNDVLTVYKQNRARYMRDYA